MALISNMKFAPEMIELILQGKKTQTRRTFTLRTQFHQRGTILRVLDPKNKDTGVRLEILGWKTQRLLLISEEDAKAEGFASTFEFFKYWNQLYAEDEEKQSKNNPVVVIYEFKSISPLKPAMDYWAICPACNEEFDFEEAGGFKEVAEDDIRWVGPSFCPHCEQELDMSDLNKEEMKNEEI